MQLKDAKEMVPKRLNPKGARRSHWYIGTPSDVRACDCRHFTAISLTAYLLQFFS